MKASGESRTNRVRQESISHKAVVSPPSSNHQVMDIVGVLLVASSVIAVFALITDNSGALGQIASSLFRSLVGRAAFSIPMFLFVLGLIALLGRKLSGFQRIAFGLFLAECSLAASLAHSNHGDFFDPLVVSASGGYIGAIFSWGLTFLIGGGRPIGVVALFFISAIICFESPIREWHLAFKRTHPGALRTARPERALPDGLALDAPRGKNLGRGSRALVSDDIELESGEGEYLTQKGSSQMTLGMEPERRTKKVIGLHDSETPASPNFNTDSGVPKEGYQLPPLSLLAEPPVRSARSKQEMQRNIEILEGTLEQFGIDANVVEVANGPTVTRFEIQLGPGIRVARITALADNIAMDLAASHVRVEAPIPGKAAIGVEVPNSQPTPVFLRDLCETKEFLDNPSRLTVALGKDVSGINKYADLTKMPHLLIGGATNSGKSIGLSTIITSLLMRNTPKDLRLVMIDPKRVELTLFNNIPHLMCPVIKDVKDAPGVLRAVWREMDRRYDRFSELGVRNIDGWNAKASFQDRMPYIVVIIDELADLMIQAAAEVETSICRLAQLARATGIHLVIATQRPSVDVITGTIKANIASRIAFTVSSQIDSRTILDSKGAESLIGRGDMLFLPIDASKPVRLQGCYVSEKEIDDVCTFWREQETPQYTLEPIESEAESKKSGSNNEDGDVDALWEEAVKWVAERGQASTSMLQRKFSIGFQRASRLLDMMEERSIVGPRDGPRPREVLLSVSEADELFRIYEPPEGGWDPE